MTQILSASAGDIHLEKHYDQSELPVPSVRYEISSEWEEPVEIRIIEAVPPGLEKDQIGFHGEFAREDWTVTDQQLIFEHEIEGNTEHETVYALKPNCPYDTAGLAHKTAKFGIKTGDGIADSRDLSWTVTSETDEEPDQEASESNEEPDWGVSGSEHSSEPQTDEADNTSDESSASSTSVDQGSTGDSDSDKATGFFDDETADDWSSKSVTSTNTEKDSRADGGTDNVASIFDKQSPSSDSTEPTTGGLTGNRTAGRSDSDTESHSVVDEFVSEIRSGNVSDENLEYLREELGTNQQVPERVEVRISKLQSDVADLQAYTDALEQFIDKHDQAAGAITEFERRLDSIEQKVETIDSAAAEQETELTAIREQLRQLMTTVESSSEELSSARARIEELSSATVELEDQLPAYDIEEKFQDVEAEMDNLSEFTKSVENAFQE